MPQHFTPRAAHWIRKLLLSRSGGFDLPAVLVTVAITSILLAGGAVMAIGIMPWSKDGDAKDMLKPVATAQQFAKSTDRRYLAQDVLEKRKLLQPMEDVLVGVGKAGGCYTAITKSETGKFFFVHTGSTEARELTASTDPGCEAVFTIRESGVPDLSATLSEAVDYLGGFGETDTRDSFSASYPDTVLLRGDAYKTVKPAVNGGTGTFTYELTGTLPENVVFDRNTGTFSAPDAWRPASKPALPSAQNGQWNLGAETVVAGNGHGCSISTGVLYCWGNGSKGQLGRGSYASSEAPQPVKPANGFANKRVTAVSAGTNFTCALEAGAVYCWGLNNAGQLGNPAVTTTAGDPADSSTDMVNVPVKVQTEGTVLDGQKIDQVSAGDKTVCAVADGLGYCWGSTAGGVRGDGITSDPKPAGAHYTADQRKSLAAPVQIISSGVLAGKSITKIDVGYTHTCAVANSRAYCWGINKSGELGTGANAASVVPVAVLTSTGMTGAVTDIDVGGFWTSATADSASTCAVTSGKTYCWGSNAGVSAGKLGIGTSDEYKKSPALVASPAGLTATAVDVGYYSACAVYEDAKGSGAAYCWGNGSEFKLGNNSSAAVQAPAAALGIEAKDVSDISVGGSHVQVAASGGAYGWGHNADGKTGTKVDGNSPRALPVSTLGGNFGFPASDLYVTVSDGVDTETVEVRLELR